MLTYTNVRNAVPGSFPNICWCVWVWILSGSPRKPIQSQYHAITNQWFTVLNTTPSPINSSLVPMDYLLLVFPKWVFSLLLLKLLVVFRHGGLFFENVRFLYLYYIAGIRRGSSCSPRNVYHPGPSSLLPGQPVSSRRPSQHLAGERADKHRRIF